MKVAIELLDRNRAVLKKRPLNKKDYAKAEQSLLKATELDPQNMDAWLDKIAKGVREISLTP